MGARAGLGTGRTAYCNDVGKVPASEARTDLGQAALVSFVSLIRRIPCFFVIYHGHLKAYINACIA